MFIKVSDTLSRGKVPIDEKSLHTDLVRYMDQYGPKLKKKVPIVGTTKGCLRCSPHNYTNFHIVS